MSYHESLLKPLIQKATKRIFQKRGFAENRIIEDWERIIGDKLARYCAPQTIKFYNDTRTHGLLMVDVYHSGLATELQYMSPIIIEKITSYFGYPAVSKIKIIQKPQPQHLKPKAAPPPPMPSLTASQTKLLNEQLSDIDDEKLRKTSLFLGNKYHAERRQVIQSTVLSRTPMLRQKTVTLLEIIL